MTTPVSALFPIERATLAAAKEGAPVEKPAVAARFSAVLKAAPEKSGTAFAPQTSNPGESPGNDRPIAPLVKHHARTASPLEKFEGFVLRSFVESMLPSAESSYFGTGTAGEVWRSMLAEEIGDEMARNGGIGIAASIAGKPGSRFGADANTMAAGGVEQRRSAVDGLNIMLRDQDRAGSAVLGGETTKKG